MSFHSPGPPRNGYGVLLASRGRSSAVRLHPTPADRGRIVAARIGDLIIAGVYFSLGKEKASLFDYLLSRPPDLGESIVVLGDFNTGIHRLDEPGATLDCADRFALLPKRGYVDLWRRLHGPEARESSWISQQGAGYRLDHAFGAGPVVDRVIACSYDHAPRGVITDHSAVLVELA